MQARALLIALLLALAPGAGVTAAVDPFEAVVAVREEAEGADAPLLAPDTYAEAVKTLERARRDATDGKDPARVAKGRDEAAKLFRTAAGKARAAATTFRGTLAARTAAQTAEAWRLVPDRWQKAEKELTAAASRFEEGDAEGGARGAASAETAFRDAELQALRSRYLADARAGLLAADKARADRYAAKTLARAQARLAEAEAALANNREDPERAAESIDAAAREANHARRVADLVRTIGDDGRTTEDVILELEAVINRLAQAAGLAQIPVAGDAAAADQLVAGVGQLHARADQLARDLTERDRQVAGLEDEIRELDARLGGATAERDQLLESRAAEQRARELFGRIEALFTPAEADVLRQGNNIVLRLGTLPFRSGSADIRADASPVLRKVQEAVALFPRAVIVIEGHATGTGSEQANQRLAEQRAEAVRAWLAKQLALPADRLRASGNGGPPAPGTSGRRIDVVITPGDGGSTF